MLTQDLNDLAKKSLSIIAAGKRLPNRFTGLFGQRFWRINFWRGGLLWLSVLCGIKACLNGSRHGLTQKIFKRNILQESEAYLECVFLYHSTSHASCE